MRSQFCSSYGGMMSRDGTKRYFFNIIDILTGWGYTKQTESMIKGLVYDVNSVIVLHLFNFIYLFIYKDKKPH
jgi:hypothetical protein